MKKISALPLIGLLILTACVSSNASPTAPATPSLEPIATEIKILPTPVSPGKLVVYEEFEVVMLEAEITSSYINEYGSSREAPAGKKLLWIHITIQNIGQKDQVLPASEHFSVLNGTVEYKSIYGRRQDHADYMTLTTGLVQGQEVDAWLRFDIPAALELSDLQFAFLPESSQISTGYSSSEYSWGDHPIYLWTCAP
jgi:hypothetical protein